MGAISTQQMVADCKQRLPLRVSSTFWMERLNEGYRWICQQGAFPWTILKAQVSVQTDGTFTMPTGWSPGRPSYLWKGGLPIPQKSWEEAVKQQVYMTDIEAQGNYSVWAYVVNLGGAPASYSYTGIVFPPSSYPAALDTSLTMSYHSLVVTPLAEAATVYFPTPPEFDELLEALAESEARRRYGAAGWDKVQARTQASIQNLLRVYVSDKHTLFGLDNVQRHAAENQAAKSV